MEHSQNIDLTLNDDTRPLATNNLRSVNNLERIYAMLTNTDINQTHDHIGKLTDDHLAKYEAANPAIKTDGTVAYVQTLITAIANFVAYGFKKTATIDKDASVISIRAHMPSIAHINIVGGEIAADGTLDSILDDADLYDKVRAFVVDIFMNAKPDTTPNPKLDFMLDQARQRDHRRGQGQEGLMPINYLAQVLTDASLGRNQPISSNKSLSNKFLWLSNIKDSQDITSKLFTPVFLATVLGHLIQLKMPHILPAIRATSDHTSLLINNTQPSHIHLIAPDSEKARYFNVYWQGFVAGRIDSYGTTAVCCDRMFSLADLQMMLSVLHDVDNALIVSWQPIDNFQDYKDLNT